MRSTHLATFAAAAALLGSGAPAHAIDNLAGTYTGKLACRLYAPGEAPVKSKRDVTIDVADIVEDPLVYVRFAAGPTPLGATIHASRFPGIKPDRARLAGTDCSLNVYTQDGVAFQAEVVIPAGSAKGTLKGALTRQVPTDGTLEICTFSAKRTATEPPGINICSIP